MAITIRKLVSIIRGRNGNTIEPLIDGSLNVNVLPASSTTISCRLLAKDDLHKDFTWVEVDGVRRVSRIIFTSEQFDTEVGSTVELVRDFTYQTVDPFDLIKIEDNVIIT